MVPVSEGNYVSMCVYLPLQVGPATLCLTDGGGHGYGPGEGRHAAEQEVYHLQYLKEQILYQFTAKIVRPKFRQ